MRDEAAMGINMAQKRAAKARRRKVVVAQKRKAESIAASLPERVRRAADGPIQLCLLSRGLFDGGVGIMVLVRGADPQYLNCAVFLLDPLCLGGKDATFKT